MDTKNTEFKNSEKKTQNKLYFDEIIFWLHSSKLIISVMQEIENS